MQTEKLKKVKLDVREDIAKGDDPFQKIMEAVNSLKDGEALEVINSFEPFPLYSVLRNKGFEHTANHVDGGFEITFYKTDNHKNEPAADEDWKNENNFNDDDLKKLAHCREAELDVRELEPPQPLLKIFEIIENMDKDAALSIIHDRKPIHLYPRLKDAGFKFLTEDTGSDLYSIKVWRN
ncbi:MAG: DUF2249 domain-containing protein [Candidatus Acididesulfobacter guangdongensis]|uniref:DUF2249 domain-containing protein n=1 Tax=Acididesulfobacter guangdongensis TaxID=2597225 RepID=A0A519BH01_ACIG2|nr:MAG: DUF2249 domain-containing protein [Candidatus Acididesulfobacter guangdongensis]